MKEKEKGEWLESGKRLELAVKAPIGHADGVAAGLVEGEGERTRDDTGLQVQARDSERTAAIMGIATLKSAACHIINKNGFLMS